MDYNKEIRRGDLGCSKTVTFNVKKQQKYFEFGLTDPQERAESKT